jgi:hypothetical protein
MLERGELVAADNTYVERQINLAIDLNRDVGIMVAKLEVEVPVTLDADADYVAFGLSLESKAAIPTIDDDDVLCKYKHAHELITSGATIQAGVIILEFRPQLPIFSRTLYFFAHQVSGAAHTFKYRITYYQKSFSRGEMMTYMKQRFV